MGGLTKARLDALDTVAWGTLHFGAVLTGGAIRKRDVEWLEAHGYAKCKGPVIVCDGDGFAKVPERYRPGWSITEKGEEALLANGLTFTVGQLRERRRMRALALQKQAQKGKP